MATRFVDPDAAGGGDGTTNALSGANCAYVSLSVWEAARQGVLGEIEECICESSGGSHTADSTNVVIDGWTTTAAFYPDIKTSAAARHAGTWSDTKFRIVTTTNQAIVNRENYTRITGLQVSSDNAGAGTHGIVEDLGTAIGGIRWSKNIIRNTLNGAGTGLQPSLGVSGAAPNILVNNLVYGFSDAAGLGIYARGVDATTRLILYNNTVYDCGIGFRVRDDVVMAKNNLSIGCTDAWLLTNTPESGSTNNGYDEGTDPAAAGINLSGSADADIFVNAAGDNFHLVAGSDAAGVGVDLSADSHYAFSEDIDGETRTAPWSIGADHLVETAPGGIVFNLQIG